MQSTNKDVRDIPISNNSPIQLITQQQRPPLNFVENVKKNKIFKFKSDLIIMYTFGTKKYYLKGYRLSNWQMRLTGRGKSLVEFWIGFSN